LFGGEKKLGIFIWGRRELGQGEGRAGWQQRESTALAIGGGRAEHYYTQIFRYFGEYYTTIVVSLVRLHLFSCTVRGRMYLVLALRLEKKILWCSNTTTRTVVVLPMISSKHKFSSG
jgi:hypothetical protein